MLMDIDHDTRWEELVRMAQDKDAWRLRVVGMKIASKAEPWDEAATAKKALRKQLKATARGTPPQPKSCFTFRAQCAPPTTTNSDAGRVAEKRIAIKKFLTGTADDRQKLQIQAKKQTEKRKR